MSKDKVCVIGLGYVGLPLAIELSRFYDVLGFDVSKKRIEELKKGRDSTREVSEEQLKNTSLTFSSDESDLTSSTIYIVTVPTPVTSTKQPDLSHLNSASRLVGKSLNKNDLVIYESTVYPGCTEDYCVPLLEKESKLRYNKDFFCGYSPERMNPGDKNKTLKNIVKITSGSNQETTNRVDMLYKKIVKAGTYQVSNIKTAEAAKIIENTQRDINIAFVNELSVIFNKMDIDTLEVLKAAETKWNFTKYYPGLVGGHCIGVDPYYLTYKSQELGYIPNIILSGRKTNDSMSSYVAKEVIKLMIKKSISLENAKTLVLGVTFKENCPDFRNTKVIDLINELMSFGILVDCLDPHANTEDFYAAYNIHITKNINNVCLSDYQAIIFCVAHKEFVEHKFSFSQKNQVVYDVKGIRPYSEVDGRL